MKKVALIGSGGAGKSTLARQLGEELNIEVYHLDSLFWKPNWVGVSKDEQRNIQQDLVEKESWIIDGNYGGTMEIRLDAADTIIFLDISRFTCLFRVIKRSIKYRNRTRPDMGEGCNEKLDIEFLKWIWQYPNKKRPHILASLKILSDTKQIIILKSPREVRSFLETISQDT